MTAARQTCYVTIFLTTSAWNAPVRVRIPGDAGVAAALRRATGEPYTMSVSATAQQKDLGPLLSADRRLDGSLDLELGTLADHTTSPLGTWIRAGLSKGTSEPLFAEAAAADAKVSDSSAYYALSMPLRLGAHLYGFVLWSRTPIAAGTKFEAVAIQRRASPRIASSGDKRPAFGAAGTAAAAAPPAKKPRIDPAVATATTPVSASTPASKLVQSVNSAMQSAMCQLAAEGPEAKMSVAHELVTKKLDALQASFRELQDRVAGLETSKSAHARALDDFCDELTAHKRQVENVLANLAKTSKRTAAAAAPLFVPSSVAASASASASASVAVPLLTLATASAAAAPMLVHSQVAAEAPPNPRRQMLASKPLPSTITTPSAAAPQPVTPFANSPFAARGPLSWPYPKPSR